MNKQMVRISCLIFILLNISIPGFSSPSVTIHYEENGQVELISSKGGRVLIDIYEPSRLSKPATNLDILLTTHTHPDHINTQFIFSFNGEVLMNTGEIETSDVYIKGFAAPHNEGDPFDEEGCSNYAFLIVMDGIRIAHLGDIGQEAFAEEQMQILGQIDLAIMQFNNVYSDMNIDNKKGFNLMKRLKPKLIIPTHNSIKAAQYAMTLWRCKYSDMPYVRISDDNLPNETHLLFIGDDAGKYAEITNASKWSE